MKKFEFKVYNLEAIGRYRFISNTILLVFFAVLWWLIVPPTGRVGIRNSLVINAGFAVSVILFMTLLEKYSSLFLQTNENIVINVLSCVYTYVIVIIANAVFFMSRARMVSDTGMFLSSIVFLNLSDMLLNLVVKIKRKARKPKLLILGSDNKTFMRMKRIKYGVLNFYDSWYEKIGGMDTESIGIQEIHFDEFDAICILDGLTAEEYKFTVKTASALGKDLFIVPDMVDAGRTNAKVVRLDDVLALYMPKLCIPRSELMVKRFCDIVFSFIGLVVAALPMLFIAAIIKLTSPGPVIYKQERMTVDKKRFMIYKFRTMISDAEKLTGPKFAEKDDPRITKVGKILRACRLDELPQIINILKGDMSIVGPRPERPVFIEQFEQEIENYDYRFAVKAGLTSLSHVYGRYSTYIHDRTYYDLFYITHYSILLDIKIILLTSKTIFLKSAAEGEDSFKEKTQVVSINNIQNETEEAVK